MQNGLIAYWVALMAGSVLIGGHVRGFVKLVLCALLWSSLLFLLGKSAGVI